MALGKMSKVIDELQKMLPATMATTYIGLKNNLIIVQNTLDLTATLMLKIGK